MGGMGGAGPDKTSDVANIMAVRDAQLRMRPGVGQTGRAGLA